MLVSSLALLFVVYAAGLIRVWRHAGAGAGISAWEATAFAGDNSEIDLIVRGKPMSARVVPMPFVPHRYRRAV